MRPNNGSGSYEVKFYTASDSVSVPTSWTQLGDTKTGTSFASIYDSTQNLQIASDERGGGYTVYRAIIKNGIGGTTVFDADFSTQTADALAFTESSSNAATVTINTTRYVWGIPNFAANSIATQGLNANVVNYAPFVVMRPIVVDLMIAEVTTGPSSNSNFAMGIYAADDNLQPTGAPLVDTGSIAVNASATGIYTKQFTPVTLQPGTYLTAINVSAVITFRRLMGGQAFVNPVIGTSAFVGLMQGTQTYGSYPNPGTTWNTKLYSSLTMFHIPQLRWKAA